MRVSLDLRCDSRRCTYHHFPHRSSPSPVHRASSSSTPIRRRLDTGLHGAQRGSLQRTHDGVHQTNRTLCTDRMNMHCLTTDSLLQGQRQNAKSQFESICSYRELSWRRRLFRRVWKGMCFLPPDVAPELCRDGRAVGPRRPSASECPSSDSKPSFASFFAFLDLSGRLHASTTQRLGEGAMS